MNIISVLQGKKVTVHSNIGDNDKQDVGFLEAFDPQWIRIRKQDGETLFFSLANIRMVKPFDPM